MVRIGKSDTAGNASRAHREERKRTRGYDGGRVCVVEDRGESRYGDVSSMK